MINSPRLDELSKIGFGGYRITSDSKEHYNAFLLALSHGCNLVDTSSNYMNGKSEELIGQILTNHPHYKPFIITKAGYIQGENLQVIEQLNADSLALNDLIIINQQFKYSLHPDFLEKQINTSLSRLKVGTIDGFLLHNPEYYITDNNSLCGIYKIIEKAFYFLENKVKEGKIKYYGISSNMLSYDEVANKKISLKKILSIAHKISINNRFKLIQFPFNLLEQDPIINYNKHYSLIQFAKKSDLIIFSNRPLNANSKDGAIRLASYEDDIGQLNEKNDIKVLQSCLLLINQQLIIAEDTLSVRSLDIINYISANWNKFTTSESASKFFDYIFHPFLVRLYQNNIPNEHMRLYSKLRELSFSYCLKNITKKAISFRKKLINPFSDIVEDKSPIQVLACKHYLELGIDHVLVGMKKEKYVLDFKSFF